ncbi:cyclin-J [Contarinia nasturtii]|uniref:cyclin-J n=1 Tax=Contarinia nasturtii TaxID=265458 RepID=UPI0012D3987A|nr:cyclin-J [Contarinia nasturtii]
MFSQSETWWCTEYADSIHDILRKREGDRLYFENKAPQIKWRIHLIQLILDIARKHRFSKETVHLAVYFTDIFMDNHMVRLWRLHLVALVSLRIAAKIEEKIFALTRIEALNATANYSKEDYNILETIMLRMLDWDLTVPTAIVFATYYAEFIITEVDYSKSCDFDSFEHFKNDLKSDVIDFVNLSLFDIFMTHSIQPSKLAAMCLAAVRLKRNILPIWPLNLIRLTRYPWDAIKPDFKKLFDIKLLASSEQLRLELEVGISQEAELEFD